MEATTRKVFAGFTDPTKYIVGYTQLPHEFMDELSKIESLAELKIILYVMRHTWGFQEFDVYKHLTTEDFMYGRTISTGRMDKGTGLSKASVITGVKQSIEQGYILCKVDDRDMARIKKSYRPRLDTDV